MKKKLLSPIFSDYEFIGTFSLPETNSSNFPLFDVLSDGRLISTDGTWVYIEKEPSSRIFEKLRRLGDEDVPFPAYIRVSPGNRVAIDKGGTVIIFNVDTPDDEQTYDLGAGYDAEWIDDSKLVITGVPATGLTILDTSSGSQVQVIQGVGGFPAGVTLDSHKNLYCANGGDQIPGGTQTGWIKVFSKEIWEAVLSGGDPIDFETSGILVADLLSAGYLEFDDAENMLVGGGVFFTPSGDVDGSNEPAIPDKGYAALVNGVAIKEALEGGSPVTRESPSSKLHEFDPNPDSDQDFYYLNANHILKELYLSDYGGDSTGGDNAIVYVFRRK